MRPAGVLLGRGGGLRRIEQHADLPRLGNGDANARFDVVEDHLDLGRVEVLGQIEIRVDEHLGVPRVDGSQLVHGVHLSEEEIDLINGRDAFLIHNARSNMNNSVGYNRHLPKVRNLALGTDGIGADMYSELQTVLYDDPMWLIAGQEGVVAAYRTDLQGWSSNPLWPRPSLKFQFMSK